MNKKMNENFYKFKYRNEMKGISMISLIITIIVLLILSTIIISFAINTGITDKAQNAVNKYSESELVEQIKLMYQGYKIANSTNENVNLFDYMQEELIKTYGINNFNIEKRGKKILIEFVDKDNIYVLQSDGNFKKMSKLEKIDTTLMYSKLMEDGTLYLRATESEGYNIYINSDSIESKDAVLKVIIEESIAPNSTQNMFRYYKNLKEIVNIKNLHTENAESTQQMFYGCESLVELDLSHFDTSKSNSMNSMFNGCKKLKKLDVSGFDTSNVIFTNYMFSGCSSLKELDVSGFDTSNVGNMLYMFGSCSAIKELDVSGFNTSNTSVIAGMFSGCSSITEIDISGFDLSKTNDINCMFHNCKKLEKIKLGNLDISNIEDIHSMFNGCNSLKKLDLSLFNTKKVKQMKWLFLNCNSLEELKLGSEFEIVQDADITQMFDGIKKIIKITATRETADKIISITNLNETNFEIIE